MEIYGDIVRESFQYLSIFHSAGLKEEPPDEDTIKPLVTDFLEVMDLLKNLPEASRSPALSRAQVLVTAREGKDATGDE